MIAILFFLVLGLNSRISEYFQLTAQRNEISLRIDNLTATKAAIETEIAYAESDKAVEEWARTYERMSQPNDQIIVPLPLLEATKEINYVEIPATQTKEKWKIWWEMFFDE